MTTEGMTTEGMTRAEGLGPLAITPRPLPAYQDMFALTERDLVAGPILDCPAGASPFGAQVRALGGVVSSVDPAYRLPPAELVDRARADVTRVLAWQQANPIGFDWSYLGSPQLVAERWSRAIEEFASDFAVDGNRYAAAALPDLPFADGRFRVAVSGFLLFAYPQLLTFDEHLAALLELVRVTSGEVRVYPLHDTSGLPYARMAQLRTALTGHGINGLLRSTGCSYSPRPGSDRMLVLTRSR